MEIWDIEEHKVWKGIDTERPCWASLQFACQSYDSASELMKYIEGNKRDVLLRVVRSHT